MSRTEDIALERIIKAEQNRVAKHEEDALLRYNIDKEVELLHKIGLAMDVVARATPNVAKFLKNMPYLGLLAMVVHSVGIVLSGLVQIFIHKQDASRFSIGQKFALASVLLGLTIAGIVVAPYVAVPLSIAYFSVYYLSNILGLKDIISNYHKAKVELEAAKKNPYQPVTIKQLEQAYKQAKIDLINGAVEVAVESVILALSITSALVPPLAIILMPIAAGLGVLHAVAKKFSWYEKLHDYFTGENTKTNTSEVVEEILDSFLMVGNRLEHAKRNFREAAIELTPKKAKSDGDLLQRANAKDLLAGSAKTIHFAEKKHASPFVIPGKLVSYIPPRNGMF